MNIYTEHSSISSCRHRSADELIVLLINTVVVAESETVFLIYISTLNPFSSIIQFSCAAAVIVISNQHFSVLIRPETIEVNQDACDCIALATVDQILQRDLEGVFRLHHVKDLILGRGSE